MKRFSHALLCSALLAAAPVSAQSHPSMYLNQSEVAAIKKKVDAGEQPWSGAYSRLISRAGSALNQTPRSVTDGGKSTGHSYDGASISGGREDYLNARAVCYAVRDLGIAYAFTGDGKYAEKAIALIDHWCLAPETYMIPEYTTFQSQIELSITMPALLYGADMIWEYSGWDASQKADLEQWARDLGTSAKSWSHDNNFDNWRMVVCASAAALTGDQSLMQYAADTFKEMLPSHINKNGVLVKEIGRTRPKDGLFYSTYALIAMSQVCEIARHHGHDLYHWVASDGSGSLEKAFDYLAPFVANPSSWPHGQSSGYSYHGENAAAFEYGYLIWGKEAYLAAINRWGRPLTGMYVQGPVTLTHAAGAYSATVGPVVGTPRIDPDGGSFELPVGVALSCTTAGADIYYTLDDSRPDTHATRYQVPFTVEDNATVRAVAIEGGTLSNEASAVFEITGPDVTPPEVTDVASFGDPTKVRISFSEAVDTSSARNPGNYSISHDVTVSSSEPRTEQSVVVLTVSELTENQEYTLAVANIRDRAQSPNSMNPQNVSFRYVPEFRDDFEDGGKLAWKPLTVERWSLDPDDNDISLHLKANNEQLSGDKPGEYTLLDESNFAEFELTVSARSPEPASNGFADYGLIFGYEDADNFYYFLANRRTSANQLFRVTDGSRIEIGAANEALLSTEYSTLELSVKNNTIRISVDGAEKISVSEPVPFGQVGLCSYNDEAYFDEFVLRPLDASVATIEPIRRSTWGEALSIHPSPHKGVFRIEISDRLASECHLAIYGIDGKLREQLPVDGPGASVVWDAAAYPAGTYLLRLKAGSERHEYRLTVPQ